MCLARAWCTGRLLVDRLAYRHALNLYCLILVITKVLSHESSTLILYKELSSPIF